VSQIPPLAERSRCPDCGEFCTVRQEEQATDVDLIRERYYCGKGHVWHWIFRTPPDWGYVNVTEFLAAPPLTFTPGRGD
jgi:hypothetical protein